MLCKFASAIEGVSDAVKHDIGVVNAVAACKLLEEHGYSVRPTTIKDHRRRDCTCYKKTMLAKPARSLKILTLDIENRPNVVHTWGLFNVNVSLNQVITPAGTFGVAYKWYGESKTHFLSDHHTGHDEMIRKTHQLMSEADIIVGFNHVGFDVPHLNREFALAGLGLPKPSANVDLLKVVRKQFRFTSNKLDFVSQQFGLGSKTQHEGHGLWVRCLEDDPSAWELMRKYAMQDVALTEQLYDTLRAYIPNHPHVGQWTGDPWSCPSCGHKDVSKNRQGNAHTMVQQYRQYQCENCGTWIRGTKKLQGPTETRISRSQ